jgi:hypothetical protein
MTHKTLYLFFTVLFLSGPLCLYGEAETQGGLPNIIVEEEVPFDELDGVFLSEDFGKTKNRWRLKLKEQFNDDNAEKEIPEEAFWVKIWNLIAAYALRALMLLLVAAVLVFTVILYRKIEFPGFAFKRIKKIKAEIKHEMAKGSAGELLEAAKIYYDNGRTREAWAALYKGTLAGFREKNIIHPLNATEYECLGVVRAKAPLYEDAFRQLVNNRILIAYRLIIPAEAEFNAALAFCSGLNSRETGGKDGQ